MKHDRYVLWMAAMLGVSVVGVALPVSAAQTSHTFSFRVTANQSLGAVNPDLLGSNLEWWGYGDSVLTGEGKQRPEIIASAAARKPTVLRYMASDWFEWKKSMPETRGYSPTPGGDSTSEYVYFGTQEFLEFSKAIGAKSLIILNMYQGWVEGFTYAAGSTSLPANDARDWALAIKNKIAAGWTSSIPGQGKLNDVSYWELGNEPYHGGSYVNEVSKEHGMRPGTLAERAGLAAKAIIKVNPKAQVLLPLATCISNNKATCVPWWQNNKGVADGFYYMNTVLSGMPNASIDAISLHNAYMPSVWAGDITVYPINPSNQKCPETYYWGAMASPKSVIDNLNTVTKLVNNSYRPKFRGTPKYAITEYGPVFDLYVGDVTAKTSGECATNSYLGYQQTDVSKWTATPAGGLYVADLIREFSLRNDILMANHWSLSGNCPTDNTNCFGEIYSSENTNWQPKVRPIYQVLQLWSTLLRPGATQVAVKAIQRETKTTENIGLSPARTIPIVEAFSVKYAEQGANYLGILLINKDPARSGVGTLSIASAKPSKVTYELLSTTKLLIDNGTDVFNVSTGNLAIKNGNINFTMPPGSIKVIRVKI